MIYLQGLPSFGKFAEKQHEIKQNFYKNNQAISEEEIIKRVVNLAETSKIPRIKDIIGVALDKIGTYNDMNNKEQVVALIDEVFIKFYFELEIVSKLN